MSNLSTDRRLIDEFLAGRRIALIGASSNPKDFSRAVMRELIAHGYDIVPVRPDGGEIEGRAAYPRVTDVPGALDGALVMTPSAVTDVVVRECAAAGVKRVWLHRGVGRGAVSDDAVAFCRAHQVAVVAGECPLMFLDGPWVHRAHAAIRHAEGRYPIAVAKRLRAHTAVLAAHAVVGWLLCVALAGATRGVTLAPVVLMLGVPLALALVANNYLRADRLASPPIVGIVLIAAVVALDLAAGLAPPWWPLVIGYLAVLVAGGFTLSEAR